ncbi:PadR family transcriptional regulator [Rathayibacter toxicus]|nr:PadR family transcriptional regulator [Rathayibacter toxicus]QWL28296.1 PadR family transcriptional regulator [Rathayibacter toxicus]QWL30376.1 PadR family transcriptional regulator [Rathayibacter toxicus]QWL32486.1 PadR family transcriptional regulator [Rathayibacter toxicus]QWL34580.1 PadR family transcriptional regulator [Rathayibacter toxicus]
MLSRRRRVGHCPGSQPVTRSSVSVRDGLLALLTLGPAYGLQLHAEFLDRAAHRPQINVGQIYSTLERLRERGLVVGAGTTEDGLPLHMLTEEGQTEAHAWLRGDGVSTEEDWDDVLDRVLLASSLSEADLAAVLHAYEHALATKVRCDPATDDHPQRRLAARAAHVHKNAFRSLLRAIRDELREGDNTIGARGFALERPRRGRRAGTRGEIGANETDTDETDATTVT